MSGDAPTQFNIHDAKTNLSRLVDRVEHGEEIVISRAGHPVAKLVPLTGGVTRRGRGSLRGALELSVDWDSRLVNDAVADVFESTR
jgi:prevent-host-death family protein